MVLASEALTSYMKAYLTHYTRHKEEVEMGDEDSEEKRSKDGNNAELVEDDDDEGFLEDYYYDIGTSAETMPNVNWTMLKPRSSTYHVFATQPFSQVVKSCATKYFHN